MVFIHVLVQIVTFAVLTFILIKVLKFSSFNETSRLQQLNEDNKQKAQELDRKISEAEHEYREKMNKAEDDVRNLKIQAQQEIDDMKEVIIAKGKAEGDHIVAQALNSKKEIRAEIEESMQEKSVELSLKIFQKILSSDEQKLVFDGLLDSVFQELENVDKERLQQVELDGGMVEVKTSHPMISEQKEKLISILSSKLDTEIKINETVDRDVITGIIIVMSSFVIDASLSERFRKAAIEVH